MLIDQAHSIPKSNGSRYHEPFQLRAGIVADIYLYNYYRDCFVDSIYLSPSNYKSNIDHFRLDLFLYTTCWTGIQNEEWRGVKFREKPKQALADILLHCKHNGVPTIFQSIEDPSNFDYFLPIAKQFDYVFTSDADSIGRYVAELGHDRVYYGEYGVNPLLNNPIGSRRTRINGAFFAGSYPTRYPERCQDMHVIFDSVKRSGTALVVADRNFGSTEPSLRYPETYSSHLIKPFDHEILQSIHKLFRYNMNFNSIKTSSTMCAMRVYELQAQCVGLLSNYARSVYNRFPGVQMVPEQADLSWYFDDEPDFLRDEYSRNVDNMRGILRDKTCFDIVGRMLRAIGLACPEAPRGVAVIVDQITDSIRRQFDVQTYADKDLIEVSRVSTRDTWREYIGQRGIFAFTYFSAHDEYEHEYLQDLVNGFKYTNAGYITKGAYYTDDRFVEGHQHEYTNLCSGKAKTLFAVEDHCPTELHFLPHDQPLRLAGGYAIDPFSLNFGRYLNHVRNPGSGAYALSVVVPVFNNGEFLLYKCIGSLRRSGAWTDMEVLLVDDGSTDGRTPQICVALSEEYGNVRTYLFPAGGSGSASRPRNKGVELASTPLISFLDPDNEISPGGYAALLKLHRSVFDPDGAPGFVSGYQVKVGATSSLTGKHTSAECTVVEDLRSHFFGRGRFPVVSTQAAVIDRRLFDSRDLRFVEGAAGQDTLFGWELLAKADKGVFTDAAFLLYYYERASSVTNTLDVRYFQKKLILERAQTAKLAALGLLVCYRESHFDKFFQDWYMKHLRKVKKEDRSAVIEILKTIVSLYGVNHDVYNLDQECV